MSISDGYLVVLKKGEYRSPRNPDYHGSDDVPAYPSKLREEEQAMDRYVFGDFKHSDVNLIPTQQRAEELLALFAGSPREFEILRCVLVSPDAPTPTPRHFPLGYDVAVINGDGWSIVKDFPDDPRISRFANKLNRNGLFDNAQDAFSFREQYIAHRLADYDMEFEVVYCERVLPAA
jgi:hypothetical protein